MLIINFSHPIVKNAALERVTDEALDQIEIIDIPVHLDLSKSLRPQVVEIVYRLSLDSYFPDIDAIRLPGFAVAAVLVVEAFRVRGNIPNIIRFDRAGGAVTRFDAVEIIRL